MPSPKEGETKDEFISRCITFVVEEEGKPQSEAIGKCFGIWENNKQ